MNEEKVKRAAPFSLRLNEEERARLEAMADGESLSAFVKRQVFDSGKRVRRSPVKDRQALAQLLAIIGSSDIAYNLSVLSKASEIGNLPMPNDVARELETACESIIAMRFMLMQALGVRYDPEG